MRNVSLFSPPHCLHTTPLTATTVATRTPLVVMPATEDTTPDTMRATTLVVVDTRGEEEVVVGTLAAAAAAAVVEEAHTLQQVCDVCLSTLFLLR